MRPRERDRRAARAAARCATSTTRVRDRLLLVATDRISAFDVVLPTPIPDKGRVLTGLSLFWFERTADLVGEPSRDAPIRAAFPARFDDRTWPGARCSCAAPTWSRSSASRAATSPARGWTQYRETGAVCGVRAARRAAWSPTACPSRSSRPRRRPPTGHDLPLTPAEARELVGRGLAERLKELTLDDLRAASAEIALERGIILADTKFEFGFADGELILVDEVVHARTRPGSGPPTRYDAGRRRSQLRQAVRARLARRERLGPRAAGAGAARPTSSSSTAARYREAYERITGEPFDALPRADGRPGAGDGP